MKIIEAVNILNKKLPVKIRRSRLQFYDRIKLVKVKRSGDNMDSREYTEESVRDLAIVTLLSFLGIDLKDIDKVVNKKEREAIKKIGELLKAKKKALKILKKEMGELYANSKNN